MNWLTKMWTDTVHSAETNSTDFILITKKPLNIFRVQMIIDYTEVEPMKSKIILFQYVPIRRILTINKSLKEWSQIF